MKLKKGIWIYLVLILFLAGCSSATKKQQQVNTVVRLQSEVLKNIVAIRSQPAIKDKIGKDPVLLEQEDNLVSGLQSVINSQQTFLEANETKNLKGSKDVK